MYRDLNKKKKSIFKKSTKNSTIPFACITPIKPKTFQKRVEESKYIMSTRQHVLS